MWKNIFRITLRILKRNKLVNLINVAGLAIGLASAIFIILYIASETSFDRYHERSADIYRLYIKGKMADQEIKGASNAPVYGPVFHAELPEIESYCRMDFANNRLMWVDPVNKHLENRIMYADSTFFEVFSIDLLEGDASTCLDEPFTILISESRSHIYFPDGDPIGRTIYMNDDANIYRVTGVVEDVPKTSHFVYDFICSYSSDERSRSTFWFSNWMNTYILVRPGTDHQVLEDHINASLIENIREGLKQFMGVTPEEFFESGGEFGVFAQPLLKIHLDKDISVPNDTGFRPLGNRTYLVIFSVIAIFILIIASINFMNLSTARSLGRAKEVGIRKVVGADRKQLVRKFLFESVFLSMLSLTIALVIVVALLNPFNNLVGLNMEFRDIFHGYMIAIFILLAILLGLLSGIYPSIVLASFRPTHILKGNAAPKNGTKMLRDALVILQFTVTMIVISGTLIIYRQFNYMNNMELGFDEEQLVVMERIYPLGDQIQAFKEELSRHPSILSSSNSSAYLGAVNNNSSYGIKGRPPEEIAPFYVYRTDYDFMETFRFELATPDSRFLSEAYPTDSSACLINETAVRKYNLEDPLNQVLIVPGRNGYEEELRIIGIVKDHHFSSLKQETGAQLIHLHPGMGGYLTVRFASGRKNLEDGLEHIEATWRSFTSDQPLQYFFLDEALAANYAEEKRTGSLTLVFSLLAILIASLGLFGLTLYNSQKRIREIGIRKTLGATEINVVGIIIRNVIYTVFIAFLIAMPVAYLIMRDWLRDFPYNVGFQPFIYILSACIAILTAILTVTVTSLKAARTNPAIALHYE